MTQREQALHYPGLDMLASAVVLVDGECSICYMNPAAENLVAASIKTLRGKLRAAGVDEDLIRTHRGLGYALEV